MIPAHLQIRCFRTSTAEKIAREMRAAWRLSYPDDRDRVELILGNLTPEVSREL